MNSCFASPRLKQVQPSYALAVMGLAMLLVLGACKADGPSLRVDLKTDFVPAAEFDAVRLVVGEGPGAQETSYGADPAANYVRGTRLDEVGVSAGQVPVTVTLLRAGVEVIARRVLASVSGGLTIATVVITRDCENVACPNDNPSFDSCFGGTCVDPRCTVETPEFCPPPECATDSACETSAACVDAVCQDGVCLGVPNNESCGGGERCDAVRGCVQARASDAGFPDAGVPDANAPDAGPDAGPDNAYFISPTGDDDAEGTLEAPFRTFSHAVSRLSPGATLVLLPGQYGMMSGTGYLNIECDSESTACDGAPCPSGTPDMPITIAAFQQRAAVIQMELGAGSTRNVTVVGCDSYVLDGLAIVGVDGSGGYPVTVFGSTNTTLRNSLFAENNRAGNNHLVGVQGSTDTLIEDCEFYDFHRYGIAAWRSRNVTARRNYFNPRGRSDIAGGYVSGAPATGDSAFACHHTFGCRIENNIIVGADNNIDLSTSQTSFDGEGSEGDGARITGNIVHGGGYGVLASSSCSGMPNCASLDDRVVSDLHIHDNIFLSQVSTGVLVRGVEGLMLYNNSFFDIDLRVDRSGGNASLLCSAEVFNNLVQVNGTAITIRDQENWSVDGNNTFPGDVSTDVESGLGTNGRIDPQLGGCFHRVPNASPINGTGRAGENVGARVVHRYVDGVLTGDVVWNPDGSFPCGAIVPGINDGATDTCATFNELGIGAGCALE